MHPYATRDVVRILKLSPGRIRGLVAHGFVRPKRGPGRAWRFSFQDLVVLRTARALALARVPSRRIRRALERLREQLPEGLPLAGLTIRAAGDRVVVHDGGGAWQAETGQYVLEIALRPVAGTIRVAERTVPRAERAAQWFARAAELEGVDREGALRAYREVLALDPADPAAYVNLGRLLHDGGASDAAAAVYRDGLARCAPCAELLFNLALVLEDRAEPRAAIAAYRRAIACRPDYADAHFNLARLYELAGEFRRAVRHLAEYRRLTRP
jgi:tetratricopeptide (TPR) repeat protein